jgi:NAD-dependent deacetylase
MDPLERLTSFVASLPARGTLLVVTGAGISVASGIPTFRGTDPGAIWKHDVTTMGTNAFFERDPVESWRWYLSRFARVFDAAPNAAHVALAALERGLVARGRDFLLVTQNVDTLHEQAGSERLVKVHGSADRVRCTGARCPNAAPRGSLPRPEAAIARFVADPRLATVPRCPDCGARLRQHVLWFDERYDSHVDYRFERVLETAVRSEHVLFVGTSFSVGVTDAILGVARTVGADVLSIDPSDHPVPYGVEALRARSEDLLPSLLGALDARA